MTLTDVKQLFRQREIQKIFDAMWFEHLYIVGSYAKNEQSEESDIDLMYVRKKGNNIGAFEFMKHKSKLEEKLQKKVDMVNEKYAYQDIKPYLDKDKVLVY